MQRFAATNQNPAGQIAPSLRCLPWCFTSSWWWYTSRIDNGVSLIRAQSDLWDVLLSEVYCYLQQGATSTGCLRTGCWILRLHIWAPLHNTFFGRSLQCTPWLSSVLPLLGDRCATHDTCCWQSGRRSYVDQVCHCCDKNVILWYVIKLEVAPVSHMLGNMYLGGLEDAFLRKASPVSHDVLFRRADGTYLDPMVCWIQFCMDVLPLASTWWLMDALDPIVHKDITSPWLIVDAS